MTVYLVKIKLDCLYLKHRGQNGCTVIIVVLNGCTVVIVVRPRHSMVDNNECTVVIAAWRGRGTVIFVVVLNGYCGAGLCAVGAGLGAGHGASGWHHNHHGARTTIPLPRRHTRTNHEYIGRTTMITAHPFGDLSHATSKH